MRKLIDLPDETIKQLKVLAEEAKRNLKNHIEAILIEYAKKKTSKKK